MLSVTKNDNILIIKNSKFICQIYSINKEIEFNELLEKAKQKYPNATHYCYAYIIDNIKRESDDGEPSGTAGIPILQVLEKNNLNHVLCIVIRYFGKIKLGAGGLLRAYTNSVTSCIKNHVITLKDAYYIKITFPYSISKNIDYLLKESKIIKKEFHKKITYYTIIPNNLLEILQNITNEIEINILEKTYIS